MTDKAMTPLEKMREPFPDNQISKLPKESRKQIEERKDGKNIEWNCSLCGGIHHKAAPHLDYVGHAALTDRLLDADLKWDWEPFAVTEQGLPAHDQFGGLWIKLTIDGVTRLGYGSADGKTGGNAVKEIIGDALRNAGMRFGAALDLWHKGDLHGLDEPEQEKTQPKFITDEQRDEMTDLLTKHGVEVAAFCQTGGVQSLKEIKTENFAAAKDWVVRNSKTRKAA